MRTPVGRVRGTRKNTKAVPSLLLCDLCMPACVHAFRSCTITRTAVNVASPHAAPGPPPPLAPHALVACNLIRHACNVLRTNTHTIRPASTLCVLPHYPHALLCGATPSTHNRQDHSAAACSRRCKQKTAPGGTSGSRVGGGSHSRSCDGCSTGRGHPRAIRPSSRRQAQRPACGFLGRRWAVAWSAGALVRKRPGRCSAVRGRRRRSTPLRVLCHPLRWGPMVRPCCGAGTTAEGACSAKLSRACLRGNLMVAPVHAVRAAHTLVTCVCVHASALWVEGAANNTPPPSSNDWACGAHAADCAGAGHARRS